FLQDALFGVQHAGPALRRTGGLLASMSCLDGGFGLAQLDPSRPPLDGGLAGLVKTARHEWPEVACKALDLAPDLADPDLVLGELVVLSGGARGVTAAVARALARACRPTLVLLGRTPEPQPEPDWLAHLSGEADIKRALGARANGNAAPRLIGEQYRAVAAQR